MSSIQAVSYAMRQQQQDHLRTEALMKPQHKTRATAPQA